jgi:WD40 repeat protein
VIGDGNGQIKIYNQYSLVNSFKSHSSDINRIKQSPFNTDTNYVATCSYDGTVKLWNVTSSLNWTHVKTLLHSSAVYALEWIDNGMDRQWFFGVNKESRSQNEIGNSRCLEPKFVGPFRMT